MFYKNYMFNYKDICETQDIIVFNKDMTNFKNEIRENGEFILSHTKGIIEVPTKEFENPYNYLENGLFKGIIPPELIVKSIEEWNNFQNEARKKIKSEVIGWTFNKWDDDFFKELKYKDEMSLKEVLKLLTNTNRRRLKYNLELWDIEKEYKNYLIKYWGDWKID